MYFEVQCKPDYEISAKPDYPITEKIEFTVAEKQVNFLEENSSLGFSEKVSINVAASKTSVETVTLDKGKVSFRKYEVEKEDSRAGPMDNKKVINTSETAEGAARGVEFDGSEEKLAMMEGRSTSAKDPIKETSRKASWGNVNKKNKKKRMF